MDFRKGANGLAPLITDEMGADPFSGVIYVFGPGGRTGSNAAGARVVLVTKALKHGVFRWPRTQEGAMRLSAVQLGALLDGMDWARVYYARRTWAPIAAN